jgi:hypothetical protein
MGLDVSAYSRMKKLDCLFNADGEPVDQVTREEIGKFVQVNHQPNFPGRADEFEDRACYSYDDSDDLRAGSYSGYNQWRNDLAKLAGYPLGQYEQYGKNWDSYCVTCWNGGTGPFSELINFSDCEGVIGSAVARKLAADFAEFQSAADAIGGFFADKYAGWRKLFDLASDGGCVRFH